MTLGHARAIHQRADAVGVAEGQQTPTAHHRRDGETSLGAVHERTHRGDEVLLVCTGGECGGQRAGPGGDGQGDITAVFSVLVAGSDMDEPIADILRGVLDGHIVLNREIAERGRFPAIDVSRSVSRSLPAAATPEENEMILGVRRFLGAYEQSEVMIRAGLYSEGNDLILDQAVKVWPELDGFFGRAEPDGIKGSFNRLALLLRRAGGKGR